MNITGAEQRAKQFPWINIAQTNFAILIFPIRLAAIYIIKRILIILCILEPKAGEEGREKRLTSTVNAFIEAVVTISGPVAEFVEVDTLFSPDALDVVEGTSDRNLVRACGGENETFRHADYNISQTRQCNYQADTIVVGFSPSSTE